MLCPISIFTRHSGASSVVTPTKVGVQVSNGSLNELDSLDSGLRRNDGLSKCK